MYFGTDIRIEILFSRVHSNYIQKYKKYAGVINNSNNNGCLFYYNKFANFN